MYYIPLLCPFPSCSFLYFSLLSQIFFFTTNQMQEISFSSFNNLFSCSDLAGAYWGLHIEESINILPSSVTFPLLQALRSFFLAVTSPHAVYLSLRLFYHLLLHVPLTDRISRMQTLQICCFSKRSSEERTR